MQKIYEVKEGDELGVIYQLKSSRDAQSIWTEIESLAHTSFFHSWAWVGSWLELILPIAGVYLFCFYHKDALKAVCCLTKCSVVRKKGLVHVIQLQLNEYLEKNYNLVNGYNGLLVVDGFEKQAWKRFVQSAEGFDKTWDEIAIGSIKEKNIASCVESAHQLRPIIDKTCFEWKKALYVSMQDEVQLLESFKRKSRQQLKQTIKAFSELGEFQVEFANNTAEALQFFDALGALHTERWNKLKKHGSFRNSVWVGFHHQFIKTFFDHGYVQMIRVQVGERPIGYFYGHVYDKSVYMHQTGFLQLDDNRLRAGCLSHFLAIQANAAKGIETYDFLPDFDESYKKFFVEKGSSVVWIHLRRKRWVFRWESFIEKLKVIKNGH